MTDLYAIDSEPAVHLSSHDIKVIVRHRDGYRCVECGMTAAEHMRRYRKKLDVHRTDPGSDYTVQGCVTLCKACHSTKPKREPGVSGIRKGLKNLNVWIRPDLYEAFQARRMETRRSKSAEFAIILENALTKEGLWPR